MVKMLKENYDNELSRLQKIRMGYRNRQLTADEKQECLKGAKRAVCEIGISMYQFSKYLYTRYQRTVENVTIHQAVDKGIELGLLQWGTPRRYDPDRGGEWQNIILTEKGFEAIGQPGIEIALTTIHLSYMPRPRRRRI